MIYAHVPPGAVPYVATAAAKLHAHADALEHAAALGGYVDEVGTRRTLSESERDQWASDAAVLGRKFIRDALSTPRLLTLQEKRRPA